MGINRSEIVESANVELIFSGLLLNKLPQENTISGTEQYSKKFNIGWGE
jgi:hypothetical protein